MCGVIHQQLPKHPPCHDTHQPHLLIIFWPSVKSWLLLLLICWNIFQPPLQLRFQSQPSPDDGTGWRWTWPPSLRAAANSAHALFLTTPQPQRPSCTGFPEYFLSWIFWTCITFQKIFLDILKISSCTSFLNILRMSKIHQCPSSISWIFWIFGSCATLPKYSPLMTQVLLPQPLENISRIELLANWSILNLALSFFETWNSGWWRFEANQPGNVPDYQVGQ